MANEFKYMVRRVFGVWPLVTCIANALFLYEIKHLPDGI